MARRKAKSYQLGDKWLSSATQIKKYRDQQVKKSKGLCEVTKQPLERPCLDHDHDTGKCRGVLESRVNLFEGRVAKQFRKYMRDSGIEYADFLIKLGSYLKEANEDAPLHYKTVEQMEKRLQRLKKESVIILLENNFNVKLPKSTLKKDVIAAYLNHFIRLLERSC